MNASSLPKIKWVIRSLALIDAKKLLEEVLMLKHVNEIRAHMETSLNQQGLLELLRVGRS
jgi:phosphotransferase system, enzyme I, PtsP